MISFSWNWWHVAQHPPASWHRSLLRGPSAPPGAAGAGRRAAWSRCPPCRRTDCTAIRPVRSWCRRRAWPAAPSVAETWCPRRGTPDLPRWRSGPPRPCDTSRETTAAPGEAERQCWAPARHRPVVSIRVYPVVNFVTFSCQAWAAPPPPTPPRRLMEPRARVTAAARAPSDWPPGARTDRGSSAPPPVPPALRRARRGRPPGPAQPRAGPGRRPAGRRGGRGRGRARDGHHETLSHPPAAAHGPQRVLRLQRARRAARLRPGTPGAGRAGLALERRQAALLLEVGQELLGDAVPLGQFEGVQRSE